MSKRKNFTPLKFKNAEENWNIICDNSIINTQKNDFTDIIPNKLSKLKHSKYISTIYRPTTKNEKYLIGKLLYGTTRNIFPNDWKKCKITSSENNSLRMNFDSEHDAVLQLSFDANFITELLSTRIFSYNFEINMETEEVYGLLYMQLPLTKFNKKIGSAIKKVMLKMFDIKSIDYDEVIFQDENIEDIYNNINEYKKERNSDTILIDQNKKPFVQHSSLLPKLRPYQMDAVQWMIKKEEIVETTELLNPLFVPITLESAIIYYNIHTGLIETEKPTVINSHTGGILADEMGLGKTVEVLACILHNPRTIIDRNINQTTVNIKYDIPHESKKGFINHMGETSNTIEKLENISLDKIYKDEKNLMKNDCNRLNNMHNASYENEIHKKIIETCDVSINTINESVEENSVKHINKQFNNQQNEKGNEFLFPDDENQKLNLIDNKKNTDSNKVSINEIIENEENKLNQNEKNANQTKELTKEQNEFKNYNSSFENQKQHIDLEDKNVPKIDIHVKYKHPKMKKKKTKLLQKTNLKVKNDFSKTKTHKSATRLAAQIWYENKLAEMVIKDKRNKSSDEDEIKCICGNFDKNNIVCCTECKNIQHSFCVGYTGLPENYICSQCWLKKPKIKSKATLIISPMSICQQWSLEIKRHIRKNGLRVLVYKGIHKAGLLYPTDLANYDLVITTYAVIQSELKFSCEEQCSIIFRNAKRYNTPLTPLLHIEWWRLCLDEAQMVDSTTSQVSLMTHQITAIHRWAVTGTPIQKNVFDLYGIIECLKLTPYNDEEVWNNLLYYPYCNGNKRPMMNFLTEVMWRSNKLDVINQINIPHQTVQEHWQEFSAVEKYFYKREHALCAKDFLLKINNFSSLDVTVKSIDRKKLKYVLAPLLTLRQACTHPLSMHGKYLSCRQVNNMKDLLDALIKKNIKECEENLRIILASFNGMAGILLLQKNTLEAVEKYYQALEIMSEYDKHDFIKIDKLQRIHTLYNLNEVLEDPLNTNVAPSLRDNNLMEEYNKIQKQYMEKYITETQAAYVDAEKATNSVNKIKEDINLGENEWICELLNWFIIESYDDELMKRIHNTMNYENCKIKFQEIQNIRAIMYFLTIWIDKIKKSSEKVYKLFLEIKCMNEDQNIFNEQIVNDVMECHLRPIKNKNKKEKKLCLCCSMDIKLKNYECILFQMRGKINKENESNKGTWHPSFEEQLLKVIYAVGKQKNADEELLRNGKLHIDLCWARRKEFRELRRLYTFYDQQISAQDELNISKIRFRLENVEEPVKVIGKKKNTLKNLDYEIENKYEFINILSEISLDCNYTALYNEQCVANEKLKKTLGTHSYLETLMKQQYSGQNPDPCPICRIDLKDSWSILSCGHCFCLDCISKIVEKYKLTNHILCSICRKRQIVDEISYIKVNEKRDNISENDIGGSYSTKIQEIIRATLILKREDSSVKILIFSTWMAVLKVLNDAFFKIHIAHELLTTHNLEEKLASFKDKDKGITVLLIPMNLGSKGLNLIEATHVFLVEPLMNPAEELQAIGRVHRIGQTKPTFVHRFLIKNTIEENIHNAISADAKQWDKNKLTLLQLKNLFVDDEVEQNDEVGEYMEIE